jgi:hypothetical protein
MDDPLLSVRSLTRKREFRATHACPSRRNATYHELILFAGVTVGAGGWLG